MRVSLLLLLTVMALGCKSNPGRHGTGSGGGGAGTGGNGNAGGNAGGSGGNGGGGAQASCSGGGTTSLKGKVFAPNGTLPLYNAIVYVPSQPVAAFTDGVTCDRCGGAVSGNPLVQTLSGADGSFELDNVPAGSNIPLVIQIGKWRRQVTIPTVTACQANSVDAASSRLPRNKSEGDVPQIAIATGLADPFECLLLKLGIDPAEITAPAAKAGRVHFFVGENGPGTNLNPPAPSAATLYSSLQNLLQYDLVILPCEGAAYDKSQAARDAIAQYVNAGGRLFTTHFSYDWLTYTNSPFNAVGTWNVNQPPPFGTYVGTLDTSFPKGMAFASWLAGVATLPAPDSFDIVEPRTDLDAVTSMAAQRWIYNTGDNKVQHMTFNTPLDAPPDDMGQPQYCGRVVFSDFHVSTSDLNYLGGNFNFPGICASGEMTTQEKALVFMLFDLSSCVQSDTIPPIS